MGTFYIKVMRFASFLRIQIHSWNANISNESCSPLHQGEEPDDTERSSGSFLFILRYLLEWWVKRRELWGGGGEVREIGQSLIIEKLMSSFWCCVLIMLIAWRILAWYHVGVLLSVDWLFSQFLQCILARSKVFCILFLWSWVVFDF